VSHSRLAWKDKQEYKWYVNRIFYVHGLSLFKILKDLLVIVIRIELNFDYFGE
jgi:hypothetical protein